MPLTRQEVEKVSLLGRLLLKPEELDRLTSQLGGIVAYIEQLSELDDKIKRLKDEFEAHKTNLDKDLDYMRASYNAEIRTLGEKIEALQKDLGQQHSQLVSLLMQLVSKS